MATTKTNGRKPAKLAANERMAVLNKAMDAVCNTMFSRSRLVEKMLDPRRNIDHECGHPDTESLGAEDYREMYDREPIANRVVGVLPAECWAMSPTVYEDEDADTHTEFEQAWDDLGRSLHGRGWHQDEQGSAVWEILQRADELSRIGRFGVLLLGLDDGKDLSDAAEGVNEKGEIIGAPKGRKLLYVRAFGETQAAIGEWERDATNPRYGQPTEYNVTLAEPGAVGTSTVKVHWTRAVHLADNLGSSEVFGTPAMQPVYNRLYDLKKLYAGSAEMYWQGALPGFSIESHPQFGADVEWPTDMKEHIEKYMTGLQRWMKMAGMTVKSLAPQVVDPTPQIDAQVEAICVQIDVPKRVFSGSERGELASSQDARKWNRRLAYRQNRYLTPRVICPFVDRLVVLGVLPEPQSYMVKWPDLDTLTPEEQAGVATKRTEAMVKYVQGDVQSLIGPLDYLTRELGYTEEEARTILEGVLDRLEAEDDLGSGETEAGDDEAES